MPQPDIGSLDNGLLEAPRASLIVALLYFVLQVTHLKEKMGRTHLFLHWYYVPLMLERERNGKYWYILVRIILSCPSLQSALLRSYIIFCHGSLQERFVNNKVEWISMNLNCRAEKKCASSVHGISIPFLYPIVELLSSGNTPFVI
jgi:hypothetical protein